jgi:hypothetical protein
MPVDPVRLPVILSDDAINYSFERPDAVVLESFATPIVAGGRVLLASHSAYPPSDEVLKASI